MKTPNKPEMKLLQSGNALKVMQISGQAGMKMPRHRTTQEAVITVQAGRAILNMLDQEHTLKEGESFIIPANVDHDLVLEADFQAVAVMLLKSKIEFNQ